MDPQIREQSNELMERADLLMVDGRDAEAKDLLAQAAEIDPANEEVHRMLAGVTARLGGHSLESTPEGHAIMADEASDLIESAHRAQAAGHLSLASSLTKRALSIDPSSADAMHQLRSVETDQSHTSSSGLNVDAGHAPMLGIPQQTPNRWRGSNSWRGLAPLRFVSVTALFYLMLIAPADRRHPQSGSLMEQFHLSPVIAWSICILVGLLAALSPRRRF